MHYVALILALTLCNCATQPPDITPCNIYSFDRADCQPTDPRKPSRDVPLEDLLGYTCLSTEDQGSIKTYIYELLKKAETSAIRPR